jgi:hypothetical protein
MREGPSTTWLNLFSVRINLVQIRPMNWHSLLLLLPNLLTNVLTFNCSMQNILFVWFWTLPLGRKEDEAFLFKTLTAYYCCVLRSVVGPLLSTRVTMLRSSDVVAIAVIESCLYCWSSAFQTITITCVGVKGSFTAQFVCWNETVHAFFEDGEKMGRVLARC